MVETSKVSKKRLREPSIITDYGACKRKRKQRDRSGDIGGEPRKIPKNLIISTGG
jgi:hypothetical protein